MSEIRKTYQVEGVAVSIRDATQAPFAQWEPPSRGEIRAALQAADWTGEHLGRVIGVNSRTVRRWTSGEGEIPYAVWAVLCAAAGWGYIWEPLPGVENSCARKNPPLNKTEQGETS